MILNLKALINLDGSTITDRMIPIEAATEQSASVDKKERVARKKEAAGAHLDNVYEAECLETDAITEIQKKTPKDRSPGEECSLILAYIKNTYGPLVVDAYIEKRRESGFEPPKTDPFVDKATQRRFRLRYKMYQPAYTRTLMHKSIKYYDRDFMNHNDPVHWASKQKALYNILQAHGFVRPMDTDSFTMTPKREDMVYEKLVEYKKVVDPTNTVDKNNRKK